MSNPRRWRGVYFPQNNLHAMNSYKIGSTNERYRRQLFAPTTLLLQALLGAAVLGYLLIQSASENSLLGSLQP
ncbi:MAG: hypothetical protein KBB38_08095 [Bacteroidia bacterium]|nr:hypothetical protein [Bacteroidia bacterium]